MPVIKSQLNPRSEAFRANAARMRGLVEDLRQKAALVLGHSACGGSGYSSPTAPGNVGTPGPGPTPTPPY